VLLDFVGWRSVVDFYRGLVQRVPEGTIAALGGAEGPSTTILDVFFSRVKKRVALF
jgi:hypothetical protein